MAHGHGTHTCQCVECGYEVEAEAYERCNTLTCPCCGARLRAKETGEYQSYRSVSSPITATPTKVGTASLPCAVCHFPIRAPTHAGEQIKCPYCGSINEAIKQGISIPTPVITGFIGLALGVIFGPAILASTKSGSEWLAKKAKERLG